ncbi:MAG: hypothetical protein JWR24_5611, partial [Actinoallomurus sp.]|nr:hypothetical protein [Actinoallomurus sp.]
VDGATGTAGGSGAGRRSPAAGGGVSVHDGGIGHGGGPGEMVIARVSSGVVRRRSVRP